MNFHSAILLLFSDSKIWRYPELSKALYSNNLVYVPIFNPKSEKMDNISKIRTIEKLKTQETGNKNNILYMAVLRRKVWTAELISCQSEYQLSLSPNFTWNKNVSTSAAIPHWHVILCDHLTPYFRIKFVINTKANPFSDAKERANLCLREDTEKWLGQQKCVTEFYFAHASVFYWFKQDCSTACWINF